MSESDQRADVRSDDVKPWTIKGIPPEERNAAISAADREGQTIGEWMRRAIRALVQSDRQKDRTPAPVGLTSAPQSDLSEVERLIAMAQQLAAVSGGTAPASVSRAGFGLLRDRLAAARRAGRTTAEKSPTEREGSQTEKGGG